MNLLAKVFWLSNSVLVQEKKFLVSGKSPHISRDDTFDIVADGTDVNHGLQTQSAGQLGLVQGRFSSVDGGNGILQSGDSRFQFRNGSSDTSGLAGRNDVLVDHVNHAQSLHLDGTGVVVVKDILTGSQFISREDTHLFEQGNVLVSGQSGNGLYTRVNSPDTTVGQHLLVGLVVVIAVEDDLPVLLQGFTGNIGGVSTSFDLVSEFSKLLSTDGVEDSVDQRNVLGGTDGTEFETSSSVGERRSSVTILSGDFERHDFTSSKVQSLLAGLVLGGRSVHEGFQVVGHIVTQVSGDNGGRGLAGTQTEVISRGGNGHAHQVTVFIDSGDNSSHDDREGNVVSSGLEDGIGAEDLDTVTGGDGPVIVLSRSVNIVERLFLKKGSKSVLGGSFFDNLHDHDVLVNLSSVGSVKGSKFELVGSDLSVTSLERNSKTPGLILDFLHAGQGSSGRRKRSHVVIAHFLSTRSIASHNRTTGHLKVRSSVIFVARDEENFLFQTDVGLHTSRSVQSQKREEAASFLVNGSVGTKKRSLLVKSSTIVRDKGGRNENCVSTAEDRR
mmetsp:Transcript_4807/g.14022  ORF Transcript_4807/g.14022 Transcript_4807/m.14022 type:complete len:556 (+) Transcript_4807:87-1754(+)